MANTVPVLNFTNTFGDLLSAQNRAAIELNTLGANNYTKDSGTLFLNGSGTGLSVTNAGLLGSAVISGTLSVGSSVSALANVFINGSGNGLEVANNSLLRGNVVTNNLTSNNIVRTTTVNASGNVYANDISANNLIRTTTLNASGNAFVNTLQSNGAISGASANIVGRIITNSLVSNTSIDGSTLTISNLSTTNDLQANNTVNTAIVIASDSVIGNNIKANNGLNSTTLSVSGGTFANTITANTLITTTNLTVTSKIDANSAPTSFFNSISTTGQLSVGGNFVINGTTVYSTNTFTLNANSNVGLNSTFGVNRGTSGANAAIRWNETQGYWDIVDVNNPTSFSKILTANLISNSLTSTSSDTFASSLAANTLNNSLTSNVSILQGVNASQNTRMSIIEGVDLGQNTTITAVNNYATTGFARANTSANTFFGTSGSANATSGITTLTSTNGVTIVGSANTLTINTPQDVRTTASPTFNSLTLTNALSLTQGGTGATSQGAALTNLLPTASGVPAGYVLATNGPGTYYWAAGGTGGGGGATPGTTIQSTRVSATGNGAGLAYSTPVYTPGASQLRVYVDGVRQFGSAYTETSGNTGGSGIVTFTASPASGTALLFEVDGFIINPYYANNITFTAPFGGIVSTANTIQLAIQDLETRKAALAGPTFTGIATSVTPSTDTSNTQIATTAFVKNSLNNSNTYTMSVSGNAGTVTNGVYTVGDQTISGTKTFNSTITGSVSGSSNTASFSTTQAVTSNDGRIATTAFVRSIVPSGVILMWSGSIATIPSGWLLCDGTNSTPDLRNRFIVGAGSTYAVGATGGSANAIVVSHTHTASVTDPQHTHTISPFNQTPGGSGGTPGGDWKFDYGGSVTTSSSSTGISVSISTEGSSATNANLPPYYALAYIMKS